VNATPIAEVTDLTTLEKADALYWLAVKYPDAIAAALDEIQYRRDRDVQQRVDAHAANARAYIESGA
jgi:hypothetical protein